MTKSKFNKFSQFYLYIKGWYQNYDNTIYGPYIKKFIVSDYNGIYPEDITNDSDYFSILRDAVIEYLTKYSKDNVSKLLKAISDSCVMLHISQKNMNQKTIYNQFDFHDKVMERAFSKILYGTTKYETGKLAPVLEIEKLYNEMQNRLSKK